MNEKIVLLPKFAAACQRSLGSVNISGLVDVCAPEAHRRDGLGSGASHCLVFGGTVVSFGSCDGGC